MAWRIGIAVALAAVLLVFLLLLLWWTQERIVFQPGGPPFPENPRARRIDFQADDGQPLFAYLVTGEERPDRAVLAFHGNADLAVALIPWASELSARTGWAVVLAEYRGYAGLPSRPSVAGAERDARAAARMVQETLGIPATRLTLFGHSLGSAIATELAAELHPQRLILESPFTSARDMARIVVAHPIELVWGLISRVHYDTERRVRSLDVPVWVAHGTRDMVVPVRMGQAVFQAARMKGELLIVDGAGHNDVLITGGERYWQWMARALGD
ncbi:MAG TPA: alpha/beta hydrolase [Gemmatimonadaceae bacterium]|nr:alpha/beta hydrolase [Gemmatimonadaceae bacterium]